MADTTATDLEIPKATYEALGATGIVWDSWAHMDEVARDVAGPMVVAELYRVGGRLSTAGHVTAARMVLARADEIEHATT